MSFIVVYWMLVISMGKIRVLHVYNSMNMGGAENFIMNVYRNIDRNKMK